jgi:hypothetical protein
MADTGSAIAMYVPTPYRSAPLRPLLGALLLATLPSLAGAAVFNVSRADDPAPNGCLPGDCSVREALLAAAATPESDQVLLLAGQYQVNAHLLVQGGVELSGQGSNLTTLVSTGGLALLRMVAFADLTVEGMRLQAGTGPVLTVETTGSLTLREVHVPANGGLIGSDAPPGITCEHAQGSCRVFDSELHAGLAVIGGSSLVAEVARSLLGPPDGPGFAGVALVGSAPLDLRDSVVRNAVIPLRLLQDSPQAAPDVTVRRTRFIGNLGAMDGNRMGWVRLTDVEFRDHVVRQDLSPNLSDRPAVLHATAGPSWRFDRALVVGSRGGNVYGAAVTVEPGGVAGFINSTFDDNTFHPAVLPGAGHGHTIGVFGNSLAPATVFLSHSTLRRSSGLSAIAAGSLLSVRWDTAQVLILNSLIRGTCAYGAGGSASGTGTIESPGSSCQLDTQFNQTLPESALRIGTLADHGGFSHSYEPDPGSALINAGNPTVCQSAPLDQRAYLRDTGGTGCDIGAVEAGAPSDAIFADGF